MRKFALCLAVLALSAIPAAAQSITLSDAWGDDSDGNEAMYATGTYSLPTGYTAVSAVMQWYNVNNPNDGGGTTMDLVDATDFTADSDSVGHTGAQPTAGQTYWVRCYIKYQWVVGHTLNNGTMTTGWVQAYAQ